MLRTARTSIAACCLAAGTLLAAPSFAGEPKHGGILKMYHRDSPGSLSIHEEASPSTTVPMMPVFNNLVIYDQHKPQNTLDTIVPDLATNWSWSEDRTKLTFRLREGVRWHDGKPFTARDVKCTFDLLTGKAKDAFRRNPRAGWYANVVDTTVNGDHEVTLNLARPQPPLLALLASGNSPIYPCHVSSRDMRVKPIGTGPFKFVEFRQNESIRIARNPDYWKKGLPYLDGIEFTIIPNRSTAILGFIAGKFDMTFPQEVSIPLIKDIESQAPHAICKLVPVNSSVNLIVNRNVPPFNDPDTQRALALALDRKAFVEILAQGKGDIGGTMLPPPEGVWGMPPEILRTIPGYGPDVQANRAEARKIMERLGYGPDKRLRLKISTRNIPIYRDPAVILLDQLKDIYIDGELDVIETSVWFGKVTRMDYLIGLNLTANSVDDPDQSFYENYGCGSERNYTGYCNREVQALFDRQSSEPDPQKRKQLVWQIDKRLQDDLARPIIYHWRAAVCTSPRVKGLTLMVNSTYNGWRFEDVWLDE